MLYKVQVDGTFLANWDQETTEVNCNSCRAPAVKQDWQPTIRYLNATCHLLAQWLGAGATQ